MNRQLAVLLLCGLAVGGCDITRRQEPISMRMGVTSSVAPLADDLLREYDREAPSVTFDIVRGNAETLEVSVEDETVDWGLVSYLPVESDLWSVPVGTDALAVIVHPSNRIAGLTRSEVRTVFQGRILTWDELGGGGKAINVVTREDGSAARGTFDELVMDATAITAAARLATSSAVMVEIVSRDVDAIGYVSLALVDTSVRPIPIDGVDPSQETAFSGAYPLMTSIRYVAGEEPVGPAGDLLRWLLSDAGQTVVGQRYAPLVR